MAGYRPHDGTAVCPEPKVFVGQIPFETTSAEVQTLFSKYGTIRSCQVISGPDGRSKGCAMILYSSWTEAELAVEGENGTTHLGGARPMVVKLADPPRRGDGPIVGIAPKKLFVGQIPATITDDILRNMFTPYGNVVEVHILKKTLGSGCAFVTYDRWAACEAAIAGLHGKTQLEGAKMPMVVKFADAKVPHMDNGFGGPGAKRGYDTSNLLGAAAVAGAMAGAAATKKQAYTGMGPGFPYAAGMYGMPGMPGMAGLPGMGGYGMGMMGMGGMGMGMGMGAMGMQPGMRPGMAMQGKVPGVGNPAMQASKMGQGVVDEASKQWKLFVGQVPFESTEADLWPVFSSIGTILELVILRTPQGKSKGCAFVTYQTREMAEKAIRQLDGQVSVNNDPKHRLLIVKYAGPSGSTSPGAAAAALGSSGSGGGASQAPEPMQASPTAPASATGAGSAPGYAGSGYDGSATGMMGGQPQMGPLGQAQPGAQDMYAAQMAAGQAAMYPAGAPGAVAPPMPGMGMPGAMAMQPAHMGAGMPMF